MSPLCGNRILIVLVFEQTSADKHFDDEITQQLNIYQKP